MVGATVTVREGGYRPTVSPSCGAAPESETSRESCLVQCAHKRKVMCVSVGWGTDMRPGCVSWEGLEAATTQQHTRHPDLGF